MLIGIDTQHTVILELAKEQWMRHADNEVRHAVDHPAVVEFLDSRLDSAGAPE
jgi:hypothetical protein